MGTGSVRLRGAVARPISVARRRSLLGPRAGVTAVMERFTTGFPGGCKGCERSLAFMVVVVGCTLFPHVDWHGAAEASCFLDGPVPPLVPFPQRIKGGIYILGGLEPSAAYAVETSEGIVLVDSGLRERRRACSSPRLASLGLDWRQVRAVLLTHAHGDHTGGAEHLRAETGAKVYAGEGDAGVLEGRRASRGDLQRASPCPPKASSTRPRSTSS